MAVTSTSVLKILCLLTIINVTSETLLDIVHIVTKDTALVPDEARKAGKHKNPVKPTAAAASVEYYDDFTELLPNKYNPANVYKPDSMIKPNAPGLDKKGFNVMLMRAKSNSYFLPPILKSDELYEEKLKPTATSVDETTENSVRLPDILTQYSNVEYHLSDEDDVKTSPRSVYGNWPSYHYTPYETEQNRQQALIEKAKDKRHVGDEDSTRVIPIHEDLSHDVPTSYVANDNPLTGNEPFFSFVLNDYYIDDKSSDDHLTFRGPSEFNNNGFRHEDYSSRNRRLGDTNYNMPVKYLADPEPQLYGRKHNKIKNSLGDTGTEKGIHKGHEFRQYAIGDNITANDKANYTQAQKLSNAKKDFRETFANKVEGQDRRNKSNFSFKKNEDNGEKVKGFHRVYRIDEYKEDKEFYKNSDNNAKLEENGTSNTHVTGSKGVLGSSAAASLSDQSHDSKRKGNIERNQFGNYLTGQDMANEYEKDFHRYRDTAKQAALSNNMDYSDRY